MPRQYAHLVILLVAASAVADEPSSTNAPTLRRVPDVVYIPTPPDVVHAMLNLAVLGEDDVLFDLGCGDGRILVVAASRFGCRAVGYDIDPLRVAAARKNAREQHVEHLVRVEHKDLFDVDLKNATVVTLYLSPTYNRRLIQQLRQMPAGSRVVSHQFGIHGLVPEKVLHVRSREDGRVHIVCCWTAPF